MHDPPSLSKGHLKLRRCSPAGAHGYLRLTFSTRVLAGDRAHSWILLQEGPGHTWPEGRLTWPGAPPPPPRLLGWAGQTRGMPGRYARVYAQMCVPACARTYTYSEKSAWKALDSRGALGPRGRTYKRHKCSQEWLHPKGPAGKEDQAAADIRSLPSGSCRGCSRCGRKRWGRGSWAEGSPHCPHQGLQRACPAGPVRLSGDGAGHCRVLTSHVQVGGGGVASACGVGRHTLVLALVRLLAALDLQGTCGDTATGVRPRSWGRVSTAFGLGLTRGCRYQAHRWAPVLLLGSSP